MLWSLLTIAIGVYVGLCLIFLGLQQNLWVKGGSEWASVLSRRVAGRCDARNGRGDCPTAESGELLVEIGLRIAASAS